MSATATLTKPAPVQPDLGAVKQRQQAAWSSGDSLPVFNKWRITRLRR